MHTGKQLEIKDGSGAGKLLCWQGAGAVITRPAPQAQAEEEV